MYLSYLAICNASLCLFYSRSSAIHMCELYFVCVHLYLLSALQGTLWALLLVQVIALGTLDQFNFHQVFCLALKMWLVLWTPQTILPLSRWHPKRPQRNSFFQVIIKLLKTCRTTKASALTDQYPTICHLLRLMRRTETEQICPLGYWNPARDHPGKVFSSWCKGHWACFYIKRSGVWILSLLHQLENTLKMITMVINQDNQLKNFWVHT